MTVCSMGSITSRKQDPNLCYYGYHYFLRRSIYSSEELGRWIELQEVYCAVVISIWWMPWLDKHTTTMDQTSLAYCWKRICYHGYQYFPECSTWVGKSYPVRWQNAKKCFVIVQWLATTMSYSSNITCIHSSCPECVRFFTSRPCAKHAAGWS